VEEMKTARSQAKADSAHAISAQEKIAQASIQTSQANFTQSLKQAQASFRDDQRAWVGSENTIVEQFDSKKPFKARIQFVNRGKTPARETQIVTGYMFSPTFVDGPSPEAIRKNQKFEGRAIIAPQASHIVIADGSSRGTVRTIPPAIQQAMEHFEDIRRAVAFFYVFGELRYKDVNDRKHVTRYCFFLSDVSASINDAPNWQLGFCDAFNDME